MNYRTKLLKICVVTGTRAEYGLLQRCAAIQDDSDLELQLIVTGMHLSQNLLTYKTIEQDGFKSIKVWTLVV